MKLVTYNIQYGLGQDGRYDLERIARAVQGADVIAMQEVDRHWQRSGCIDQPATLAAHLPDYHWVYGANLDMDASFRDKGGGLINRRRQFGTLLLSKRPVISSRNFPLPKTGLADNHSIQQGALEAVIDTPLGPIRFYSIHLSHLCSETRMPQVETILDIHRRAPAEGGAWCGGHPEPTSGWTEGEMPPMPDAAILLGDFNFEPDSPEFAAIAGPVAGQYGRLRRLGLFFDAWDAAGNDAGAGTTISDRHARIDHCFPSTELHGTVKRAWIDNSAVGSDHFPLWTEFDG